MNFYGLKSPVHFAREKSNLECLMFNPVKEADF
jgi:hypothetical protein